MEATDQAVDDILRAHQLTYGELLSRTCGYGTGPVYEDIRRAVERVVRALDDAWAIIHFHPDCEVCEQSRDSAEDRDAMCPFHVNQFNALWERANAGQMLRGGGKEEATNKRAGDSVSGS